MFHDEQATILKKVLELSRERGKIDEEAYSNAIRRIIRQQEESKERELDRIYSNMNQFLKEYKNLKDKESLEDNNDSKKPQYA
ncbi:hypothetical protein [Paenibacillus solani]|uniref:hypothetical protein n=1 Tax=Paenibacillus solani TaxID=1705565 RepID=UPI003D282EA7